MARPIKNTVDYFPHIIKNGKTIFILESKFGNDGYAFWFKLLELLGSSDNHIYDYNNLSDWEFLIAKTKVSEEKANNILKTLADIGAIDSELLEKKIIWCENFIKGIEIVYKNRKQEPPKKPLLVVETPKKRVITSRNPTAAIVSTTNNPHSIVKDTIVKDSKEDIKEMPITTFSDTEEKDKENTLLVNKEVKEKKPPNHIEFDFEMWSWHGIDDDIMDRWGKIFPNVEVSLELIKMREFFKSHPGHEKVIEEKFKNNFAIYIFNWLERTERYNKENIPETVKGG